MPQSSVQISGISSSTWASRSAAPAMSVPVGGRRQRRLGAAEYEVAAHAGGEVEHHVDARGADAVDDLACTARGRAAPRPVSGSRTWMCTTAAPASAASIADSAISPGVTGTCGLFAVVSPAPVTAHVMKTFQFTAFSPPARRRGQYRPRPDRYAAPRRPSREAGRRNEGAVGDVDHRDRRQFILGGALSPGQLLIGEVRRRRWRPRRGSARAGQSGAPADDAGRSPATTPVTGWHAPRRLRREHERHHRRPVHRHQGRPGPPRRRLGALVGYDAEFNLSYEHGLAEEIEAVAADTTSSG